MSYSFDNERPIYLQIVEIIKNEIFSGILKPNDKLPSVREYATIFKANPNTIAKALLILEQEGYIYTERTNGKFVSNNLKLFEKEKEVLFKEKVNTLIDDLIELGFSKEDVIKKLMEELKWV